MDYTRITKTDNISQILDLPTLATYFPARITRGPNLPGDPQGYLGPITGLDLAFVNIARARLEAYDLQLDYHFPMRGAGSLDFFVLGTWEPKYLTQTLPDAPFVNSAGVGSGAATAGTAITSSLGAL